MQPETTLVEREAPAGTGLPGAAPDDDRAFEKGLDALQQETRVQSSWRSSVTKALLPVAALIAVLYAWQMYVWIARPRPDQLPGPADVFGTLGTLWQNGEAVETVLTSLQRGVVGFAIAVVIATPLGLLLAQSKILRGAFGPLISGLQVLPSVAWVPAAVIWFGLSDATVYFVVLMGAIPSITNGLIAGVDHVPDQHRRVAHVLGANRWELATRIVLPAALPSYVSGLKQGWAFSWRSLMAAEIIATGGTLGFGLGALLDQGRQFSSMATVIAAILLILFIGIVVELLIFGPLERHLLRRRGLLTGGSR
ncbi:ABC transporter permease [uncultured Arthrobacter sp.]|uniref:ABC transporter permease n=1 Tax=uncultured Arthrobacter sp. TaxID=114050 RepID=UPI0026339A50|nr:ABC transporter permease [uncultured Arthrobacter sp.]